MIVDDDKFIIASIERSLHGQKNWQVDTFSDPIEALRQAEKNKYDLFLSDYMMPAMDGLSFLEKINSLQPDSIRLMLSGEDSCELDITAKEKANVFSYVMKPVQKKDLIEKINDALLFFENSQKRAS